MGYRFWALGFKLNLADQLKQRGKNAKWLAERLGISPAAISQWDVNPKVQTILNAAREIECSVEALVIGIDQGYDEVRTTAMRRSLDAEADALGLTKPERAMIRRQILALHQARQGSVRPVRG